MVVRTLVKRRDRPRPVDRVLRATQSRLIWSPSTTLHAVRSPVTLRGSARPARDHAERLPSLAGVQEGRPLARPSPLRGSKGVVPPCQNTDETSGDVGSTCLPLRACRPLRRFRVGNASRRMAARQSSISARLSTECGQPCGQHVHLAEGGCGTAWPHPFSARLPCGNLSPSGLPKKFWQARAQRPPAAAASRVELRGRERSEHQPLWRAG
jgi:hypothetical protein